MKRTFRIFTLSFCITLLLIAGVGMCMVSYSHAKMLSLNAASPTFDSEVPHEQITFTLFDRSFSFERFALRNTEEFLHENILHVPLPLRLVLWQKQAFDALFSLL